MTRSVADRVYEFVERDEHGLIHAGQLFGISPILTVSGSGKSYVVFTTGPKKGHVKISCVATGSCIVRVSTGAVVPAPGPNIPFGNYNTLSSNTATCVATGPATTVSSEGTVALDFLVPGGTGGNAVGGTGGDGREIIYQPNLTTLVSIENLSGSAIQAELYITVYEDED